VKLFLLVIIVIFFAAGSVEISAQSTGGASKTGAVVDGKSNKSTAKISSSVLSRVDFKNFTFPDFNADKNSNTFTLKDGKAESTNNFPKYTLRKTYYFDLTGDKIDEAVTHIIADGCQMGCDSSNLFYIHTADENKNPKLLWKIATGGNVLGGLKAAHFRDKEIVMEVFGDCFFENLVIKPDVDMKKNARLKTTSYTRFVFSLTGNGFTQTAREILPITDKIKTSENRSLITFGKPD
jgi:hypothetical protein